MNDRARMLVVEGPYAATIVPVDEEPLADGTFRLDTSYSGVSAGTELTYFKGTNPYLHTTFDDELALFAPGGSSVDYPVRRLGYMGVGVVRETRTAGVAEGATIAAAYGHRTCHVVDALRDHFVVLPADLDPLLGIYLAHLGPICANGLLHAAADITRGDVAHLGDGVRGRLVAVTGAGAIGLLTALFARRSGASEVVVIDRTTERLAAAESLGLEVLDERVCDPAEQLKRRWRHGAKDRGADVVFQCRGRSEYLTTALRSLRHQGTVVDLAFYQGGASDVRLGEEFHHNGLTVRCAQISRVPRGLAHVWDRRRLSAETLALLNAEGASIRRHVITDVVPFDDAPTVLEDLAHRRRHCLQLVLAVGGSPLPPPTITS